MAHDFAHEPLALCPFMPVFGAPSIMFERGAGTELWDTNGKRYLDFLAGIAVVSLGHANPTIADAIADQAHRLLHVSNFFTNPVAARGGDRRQRAAARGVGPRGAALLHQLRCRVDRMRHQVGPQARRTGPPHGGERARELPRAHAGRARRHRSADEARTVPADARGIPARRMGRPRRHARRGRRIGRSGVDRADAGRRRRPPGEHRVPPRHPRDLRRGRGADDDRRDPDRVRAHRAMVRLRGVRGEPRRGDAGQGDGQRHAGRRLLGAGRRRRRLRARRPRQHLFGHGHRDVGGRGDDPGDAPDRRAGARRTAGQAADGSVARSRRCRRGPRSRPAARRGARRRPRCQGRVRRALGPWA